MIGGNVSESKSGRIDHVDLISYSVTDDELGNVGHGTSDLERETDEVVFADGNDFERVGQF